MRLPLLRVLTQKPCLPCVSNSHFQILLPPQVGEELLYDYRFSGKELLPCNCGARNCRSDRAV